MTHKPDDTIQDLPPDERAELYGTEPEAEWQAEQEYCDRAAGRATC